jgi:hypothetical protein
MKANTPTPKIGKFSGEFYLTGYGPRPIVDVDTLPQFKNLGYNHFVDANYTVIRVENMSDAPQDETYPRTNIKDCYWGWIVLRDPAGETTHAFIDPVDWNREKVCYDGKEYTVGG